MVGLKICTRRYTTMNETIDEMTEEELEQGLQALAHEFLAELTSLSKEYGFTLGVCIECEEVTLEISSALFYKYKLEGDHVVAEYIPEAKTI